MENSKSDLIKDGVISNCCEAPVYEGDICAHCGDGCVPESEEEFFNNVEEEGNELLDCPKCQREYDEIDQEYQICSYCGWSVSGNSFTGTISKSGLNII